MECQYCNKYFVRKDSGKRHVDTVHAHIRTSQPPNLTEEIKRSQQALMTSGATPVQEANKGFARMQVERALLRRIAMQQANNSEANEETSSDSESSESEEDQETQLAECVECEDYSSRQHLLKCLGQNNIEAIFELIEGVLSGDIPITNDDKKKLRRYRVSLRKLRKCRKPDRLRAITKDGAWFLKDLLGTVGWKP